MGQEEQYEWFKGYKEFSHLITPHLQPTSKILVLGCGNSSLTADLYSGGFHCLTSVDLSPAVIQRMQHRAINKVPLIPCLDILAMLSRQSSTIKDTSNRQEDACVQEACPQRLISDAHLKSCIDSGCSVQDLHLVLTLLSCCTSVLPCKFMKQWWVSYFI